MPKRFFSYLFIIVISIFYVQYIFRLKETQWITENEFAVILTTIVGWGIVFLLGSIHLETTRLDNRRLKREEIRKSFEKEALRDINKATTNLSNSVSALLIDCSALDLAKKLFTNGTDNANKLSVLEGFKERLFTKSVELRLSLSNFIIEIEANEIAVIELVHFKKYIQFKFDDIFEGIDALLNYFDSGIKDNLIIEGKQKEFVNKSLEFHENIFTIKEYLLDYRVEVMNLLGGDIFGYIVGLDKSKNKNPKSLKEIATKEHVEKETKRRNHKALSEMKNKWDKFV